jgi:regulator of replication initiation timing
MKSKVLCIIVSSFILGGACSVSASNPTSFWGKELAKRNEQISSLTEENKSLKVEIAKIKSEMSKQGKINDKKVDQNSGMSNEFIDKLFTENENLKKENEQLARKSSVLVVQNEVLLESVEAAKAAINPEIESKYLNEIQDLGMQLENTIRNYDYVRSNCTAARLLIEDAKLNNLFPELNGFLDSILRTLGANA